MAVIPGNSYSIDYNALALAINNPKNLPKKVYSLEDALKLRAALLKAEEELLRKSLLNEKLLYQRHLGELSLKLKNGEITATQFHSELQALKLLHDILYLENVKKLLDKITEEKEQKERESIARLAKYINATLDGKRRILEQIKENNEEEINSIEYKRAAGYTITLAEEEKLKKLNELNKSLDDQLSSLEKAQRIAKLQNATLTEKVRLQEENRKAHEDAVRLAEEEEKAEILAAKAKKEAAEEALDPGDSKYDSKLSKIQEAFDLEVSAAGDRKNSAIQAADTTYGTGQENRLGVVLGGAAEQGGAISSILGLVGDVQKIVLLFTSGNPIEIIITILSKLMKLIDKGFEKINKGVEMYASLQEEYFGKVNARLDGLVDSNGKIVNYKSLSDYFVKTFWSNPYVSLQSLITTMSSLVEQGIAFNLEQRTILAELSDRMVSTFNMLDEFLLRNTRLQQADMSIAELGSQSFLTELLNQTFNDSSYMNSLYKSVANSLVSATSLMSNEDATSFSYSVLKWLGALYSVGMSESTITKLAEALGALASGDYDKFESDESMLNLFGLAAGGSYADILQKGLTSSGVDALMQEVVELLDSINSDTSNVLKQAKAGIFGDIDISDLRAIANLTTEDVNTILSSNATWENTKLQVSEYLIPFAEENTHFATMLNNFMDNTLYNIGEHLVESSFNLFGLIPSGISKYAAWKLGDVIGGNFGETIQSLVDLTEIGPAMWTVLKGFTNIGSISNLTAGNTNQNLVQLLISDSMLISSRGDNYTSLYGMSGVTTGVTSSTSISSVTNDLDTYASTFEKLEAQTVGNIATGVIEETATVSRTINDLYKSLFETKTEIKVILLTVSEEALSQLTNKTYKQNIYEFKDKAKNILTGKDEAKIVTELGEDTKELLIDLKRDIVAAVAVSDFLF